MASEVILHIGTMKSATTYLQALCDVNTEALAAAGVRWPGSRLIFAGVADLLGVEKHHRPRDGDWPTLAAEISAHPGTVLISNELLSLRGATKLEPLMKALDADIKVVITARDLVRVIPSQWQTSLRNRGTVPWAEFIGALSTDDRTHALVPWFWRRQDIPRIIETWCTFVSSDAISVVTVPPSGSPPDLIAQRFMSVLDVGAATLAPVSATYPSYGAATAEFMRRLNERLAELSLEQYRKAVLELLARRVLGVRTDEEAPITLTSDQRAWARDRSARMIALIRASGVSVVGDLGDLVGDEAVGPDDVPAPSDAELLTLAIRSVVGLIEALPAESPVSRTAG